LPKWVGNIASPRDIDDGNYCGTGRSITILHFVLTIRQDLSPQTVIDLANWQPVRLDLFTYSCVAIRCT